MTGYVTGNTIKSLREKLSLTQKQLADKLSVSDKTISKWETGRGLPDITLLEPLSKALRVSVAELISGNCAENRNTAANMLKTSFYVCPLCGNVIAASGEGAFSCCGIELPVLEAEEADDKHEINIEIVETDYYITLSHPQTKEHYISFLAYVSSDTVNILKLYPEQSPEGRFHIRMPGYIYAYCNRHGLYRVKTPPRKRAK